MKRRTPAAEALTDLILEVFRVNGDLLAEGDRITKPFAQTSARWQVLGALENKAQPVAGIARDMGLARQSVQRTADLLAADGLVEYTVNPAHRRAKLVRLTPVGHEVLAKVSREQVSWANQLAQALPVDARPIREAVAVLRHLRSELENGHDPTWKRPKRERQRASAVAAEGGTRDGKRRAHQPVRGRGGEGR
jgi:DNA-binding MarR family transcriptional regulator